MKLFALIFALTLPGIAMAHEHQHGSSDILQQSPVTAATLASLELFESAHKGEIYAFQSTPELDDVGSQILYVNNGALRLSKYDCHFHSHGDHQYAHCHDMIDESSPLVPPASMSFEVDRFIAALSNAADIFARKVAPLSELTTVKMWQSGHEMFVNMNYKKAGQESSAYFMCHVHGSHIDCHRSLNPGPQEPAF